MLLPPFMLGPKVNLFSPDPSRSECKTLLTHTDHLIRSLECAQSQLYAVSESPDDALIIIQGQLQNMLWDAKQLKKKLEVIKSNSD